MLKKTLLVLVLAVLTVNVGLSNAKTTPTAANSNITQQTSANNATMWKGTCSVCNRNRLITSQKRPTSTTCLTIKNGDRCKGTVIWQAK
jgi:cytochrome c-type biogenesis protein CcmH/NrfF